MPDAPCGVVGAGTGSEEVYDFAHNVYARFSYDFAIYNKNFTTGALTVGTYNGLMHGLKEYGVEGYKDYFVCHQTPVPLPVGVQVAPAEVGLGVGVCGSHPGPKGLSGEPTVDFSRGGIFSVLIGANLTVSAIRVETLSTVYAKYYLMYQTDMSQRPEWRQVYINIATRYVQR
jgi:hypothetical protein